MMKAGRRGENQVLQGFITMQLPRATSSRNQTVPQLPARGSHRNEEPHKSMVECGSGSRLVVDGVVIVCKDRMHMLVGLGGEVRTRTCKESSRCSNPRRPHHGAVRPRNYQPRGSHRKEEPHKNMVDCGSGSRLVVDGVVIVCKGRMHRLDRRGAAAR